MVFGRESQVAALHSFLSAVPAGPAGLAFTGEAGVGKTTLWDEGVAQARRRSYRVLWCSLSASEAQYPYAGLGDILADVGDETLTSVPELLRRALDVALVRAEAAGQDLKARAVAMALRAVLVRLAETGPVVVAIDDAHWLDPSSSQALVRFPPSE